MFLAGSKSFRFSQRLSVFGNGSIRGLHASRTLSACTSKHADAAHPVGEGFRRTKEKTHIKSGRKELALQSQEGREEALSYALYIWQTPHHQPEASEAHIMTAYRTTLETIANWACEASLWPLAFGLACAVRGDAPIGSAIRPRPPRDLLPSLSPTI